MEKTKTCCICGCTFVGYGNNPSGAAWKGKDDKIVFGDFKKDDRCCDACNNAFVLPGRIYSMTHRG